MSRPNPLASLAVIDEPASKSAGKGAKARQTRARIRIAAAEVIGREGYPNASIAKIAEAAGISNGLFYYYYDSREQLFDALLPTLGEEMVADIVAGIEHLPWGKAREMASFVAYFDYLKKHPEFVRIFTEAQVYAPEAYRRHLQWIIANFVSGLAKQLKSGHLKVAEADLTALAYTLMGVRNYATQMLYGSLASGHASRAAMVRVYDQVLDGVFVS